MRWRAWFLDLPYLTDSRWRHLEYALCSEHRYHAGLVGRIGRRSFLATSPLWLFAITVFYVAYGPSNT